MSNPVARLPSSSVIDVDLLSHARKPVLIAEARRRIALKLGVKVGRIRLVEPAQHRSLEDHMVLGDEVGGGRRRVTCRSGCRTSC